MLCKKCGALILAKEQACVSCGSVIEEPKEWDYTEYPRAMWMSYDQNHAARQRMDADLEASKDKSDILKIREKNIEEKMKDKKDIDHVMFYYEREKLVLFYGFEHGFLTREELKEFLVVLEKASLSESIVLIHLCDNKKRLYAVCRLKWMIKGFCTLNEEMIEQAQTAYREIMGEQADILVEKDYFDVRWIGGNFAEVEQYFQSEEAQSRDATEELYDMFVYECMEGFDKNLWSDTTCINDYAAGYLGVLRSLVHYGVKKQFSSAKSLSSTVERMEGILLNSSATNLLNVEINKRGKKEIEEHKTFLRNELARCEYYTVVKDIERALGDGCYIATAVYGSYDAREVIKLREFRDNVLAKCVLGRGFIKVYYAVSPWLSVKMKHLKKVNALVKKLLDSFVERL